MQILPTTWVTVQQKHLQNHLEKAKSQKDEEAETQILAILQRENERAYWRRLNYSMSAHRASSAKAVQVEADDGTIVNLEGKYIIEKAILPQIHDKRFDLAGQAPICQGTLRGEFGYLVINKVFEKVLEWAPIDMPPTSTKRQGRLWKNTCTFGNFLN